MKFFSNFLENMKIQYKNTFNQKKNQNFSKLNVQKQ